MHRITVTQHSSRRDRAPFYMLYHRLSIVRTAEACAIISTRAPPCKRAGYPTGVPPTSQKKLHHRKSSSFERGGQKYVHAKSHLLQHLQRVGSNAPRVESKRGRMIPQHANPPTSQSVHNNRCGKQCTPAAAISEKPPLPHIPSNRGSFSRCHAYSCSHKAIGSISSTIPCPFSFSPSLSTARCVSQAQASPPVVLPLPAPPIPCASVAPVGSPAAFLESPDARGRSNRATNRVLSLSPPPRSPRLSATEDNQATAISEDSMLGDSARQKRKRPAEEEGIRQRKRKKALPPPATRRSVLESAALALSAVADAVSRAFPAKARPKTKKRSSALPNLFPETPKVPSKKVAKSASSKTSRHLDGGASGNYGKGGKLVWDSGPVIGHITRPRAV